MSLRKGLCERTELNNCPVAWLPGVSKAVITYLNHGMFAGWAHVHRKPANEPISSLLPPAPTPWCSPCILLCVRTSQGSPAGFSCHLDQNSTGSLGCPWSRLSPFCFWLDSSAFQISLVSAFAMHLGLKWEDRRQMLTLTRRLSWAQHCAFVFPRS